MSSSLVDQFKDLSLSPSIISVLDKRQFNVCINIKEFDNFNSFKYSSRVLINYKDMIKLGLKAGALVKIYHEVATIQNIFEIWPSILTKPNGIIALIFQRLHFLEITFGSLNLSSWLKIEVGSKVDLISVNLNSNPFLTAKNINITYIGSDSLLQTDLIVQWLKLNYFSGNCNSFIVYNGQEIHFNLEVLNNTKDIIYQFEENESVFHEKMFSSVKSPRIQLGGLETQYVEIFNIITSFFDFNRTSDIHQIKLPHGILLFGPPGCGKTLLVKYLSESIKIPVVQLNASDFSSGVYGESEARLKEIFVSAKRLGPCILFMDELDSLCPKRENSSSAFSQRITTLILTLMDGCDIISKTSKIFFIGATNMPSSIDAALRRPGRFDREIEIAPPSSKERYTILKNILLKYPNEIIDSDLKSVADMTHGYVGSDLSLLCKESYLNSIKNNSFTSKTFSIQIEDVHTAFLKIRPSAMREVFVEVPKVKWADIGGQSFTKQKLIECVEWPIKFPERFESLGIQPPKGILLFGPPGCSKTLLAKALASESGLNFLAVKGPEIFSKFIGESEKKIREIFRKARQASPSIIFFDEFDSIAGRSHGKDDSSSVSNRVMSQLLNEMDGLEPLVNVIIVAATNKPDLIDRALLRPGRFDRHIYISLPDFEGRVEIFSILMKRMPFDVTFVPEVLAGLTEGFSGAEIVSLCQNAALKSLERDISSQIIIWEDFEVSLLKFKKQIDSESLRIFEKFIE